MAWRSGAAAGPHTLRFAEMLDGMPLPGRGARGLPQQDLSCRY